jgi:DNA-binding transcriptional ArsR family regulator
VAPDPKSRPGPSRNQTRDVIDQSVIKALAHPVRAQALMILNERIASPNEIAQELDQSVGHVSYHISVLKKCECIELVDTASRRGAVEHYYRAITQVFLGDEDWRRLPASIRPSMAATLLQSIVEDAGEALDAGTFDARGDSHIAWTSMIVDEQGWGEAREVLQELLDRVLEIRVANAKRLTKSGESGIQITVASLGYETPAVGERRPAPLPEDDD